MREMGTEERKEEKRSFLIAGAFSFLFAAALLFGARLDSVENVDVRDWRLWASILRRWYGFCGGCLIWRRQRSQRGIQRLEKKLFRGKECLIK